MKKITNKIKMIMSLATLMVVLFSVNLRAENSYPRVHDFDNSGNINIFYNKLASNLKGSGSLTKNGALMQIASTFGQYQLQELEKVNPRIRRLTHLEISLWRGDSRPSEASAPDSTVTPFSGSVENSADSFNDSESRGSSSLKVKAHTASRAISLEYKSRYFDTRSTYSLAGQGLNVTIQREILSVKGKINYNTSDSRIETMAEKNINRDLRVQFSASKNLNTSENFAGVNLSLGF